MTDAETGEPRPKRRKKSKKIEDAKPAPIPGGGTADGDRLREALRAYDAGDFVLVRARCKQLANAEDAEVRNAAAELLARIAIDPAQIAVVVACLVILAIIVYVWVL